MTDVNAVVIKGFMPYDLVQKADVDLTSWFALFASPSWGLNISYSEIVIETKLPNGEVVPHYEFLIEGEEILRYNTIEDLLKRLENTGAFISYAKVMDMSNEGEWKYITNIFD